MDGTLVDTFNHMEYAYAEALKTFGKQDMSNVEFRSFYERNLKTVEYLEHFGIDPANLDDFRKKRDEIYIDVVKTKVEWIYGARELLENFRGKVPLAIATGAQRSYIEAIHGRLGLLEFIPTIVCSDDEGYKRKPDPSTLLKAAHLLDVNPESALYVGDQLTDVQAAKMANMKSCLLTNPAFPIVEEVISDFVVGSLEEMQRKVLAED